MPVFRSDATKGRSDRAGPSLVLLEAGTGPGRQPRVGVMPVVDSPGGRGDAAPMHRAPRRTAAIAALALSIVACGGTPPSPALTDPVDILAAAATGFAEARTVHVDVAADGELALDVTGTGNAAPVVLTDTTAALDLDLRGGDARATFAIPGLLGLRGEVIALDGETFFKSTLTGAQYQRVSMGDAAEQLPDGATPDPSAVAEMVSGLREVLERPGVDPVLAQEVTCGSGSCYVVTLRLTPEELAALGVDPSGVPVPGGLPVPIPDVTDQTVDLAIRVDKSTTRLAGMTVGIAGGETGDLTAELTFTDWDEDLSISAPPADQVAPG